MNDHRHPADRPPDLGWVIDDLESSAPGIGKVIVATADGRTMAASAGMPTERADQFAAITCGVTAMAVAAAAVAEWGEVRQSIVEMAQGYLVVMAISDGSCLAVLAAKHVDGVPVDLGVIGFQMARLVTRLGEYLTPALRAELATAGQR